MLRTAFRRITILSALLCLAAPAAARAGDIGAELIANRVVRSAAGVERLEPVTSARPGEIIEYRAVYTNRAAGAAKNLQGTLPLPEWAEYLPGTAKPPAVMASVDGKVYEPVPLKRRVKHANGYEEVFDVPLSQYRSLRWNLGEVAPGASAESVVRVRVTAGVGSAAAEK